MRGMVSTGFFKCSAISSAPDGWSRKREVAFPLPQVKRPKLLGPIVPPQVLVVAESGEDNSSKEEQGGAGGSDALSEVLAEPNDVDVLSASQESEKSCLYPSVVYEGDIATVKLGVGQMVILDGCAMVQVDEGHADMLGYSFPRGTDILVCSNSKLSEVITIEARHACRGGGSGGPSNHGTEVEDAAMIEGSEEIKSLKEALGCQLRFASHSLGQQTLASGAGSGRNLSFRLEFVGSPGSSLGKKRGRQFLEQQNQGQDSPDSNKPCCDDDQLDLDSEAGHSDSVEDGNEIDNQLRVPEENIELATNTQSVEKRKGCGQSIDSVKRQRVVEMLDSYSSATSIPHDWKEAVGTITRGASAPVIAIAVQRMLESLRLLGS